MSVPHVITVWLMCNVLLTNTNTSVFLLQTIAVSLICKRLFILFFSFIILTCLSLWLSSIYPETVWARVFSLIAIVNGLCSTGSSTFITEPYYREFYAGGDAGQGYAPSRSIYGDVADGPPPPQSAYEARFVTHAKSTPVYTKTVTAAGLTVDLPSPDSGIGADAITPRDQNTIQQVNLNNIFYPLSN